MKKLLALLLLVSCSTYKVAQTGGGEAYRYEPAREYTRDELRELAPKVVVSKRRDPPVGTLDELFSPAQPPLKRVGILVFETSIQPTRSGLAGPDRIYLSAAGKQLLTESFLDVWEESFPILAPGSEYVTSKALKASPAFAKSGSKVVDHLKSDTTRLAPDHIFFLENGKHAARETVLNPRGLRDLSFVLVPATELMGGPKWSDQNKHIVNEVARDLGLDAVILVMSRASWTAARKDKHSEKIFPEELKLTLETSVLVPFSSYQARLAKLDKAGADKVSVCYRSYQAQISAPARISVPPQEQNFDMIMEDLVSPLTKSYKDLAQMTIIELSRDLEETR